MNAKIFCQRTDLQKRSAGSNTFINTGSQLRSEMDLEGRMIDFFNKSSRKGNYFRHPGQKFKTDTNLRGMMNVTRLKPNTKHLETIPETV